MMQRVSGRHFDTGAPVTVDVGWTEGSGYWFGIDDERGEELRQGGELTLPELIRETRAYIEWTSRLFNTMERAPADVWMLENEGDPVAKLIAAVRSRSA